MALVGAGQSGVECVISYFCIVNLPGAPGQDIQVLDAADDGAARQRLAEVAARWPGFETLSLYHGERLVSVQGNPHWGLTSVEDRDLMSGVLSIAA